jgi:hypothetical protein
MEKPPDKDVFRRYLLGDLPETEKGQVEESFLSDPEYRESVLITEDELIDDYIDGLLSEQECQRFTTYFLATPQQQQKLRIARSLKKYAVGRPLVPVSPEGPNLSEDGRTGRSRRWFNLRNPLILLPMAAALLIVASLGILKLNEVRRTREQLAQEHSRRTLIEQQLALVNSLDGTSGKQVFSVVLPPVSVRGAGSSRKVSSPGQGTVVELQLVISGQEYPAYRAVLQKVDSSESFAIHDLRIASAPAGKVVPLRIPPDFLTRGTYRLQLFGVTANGVAAMVDGFDFQVTDNP